MTIDVIRSLNFILRFRVRNLDMYSDVTFEASFKFLCYSMCCWEFSAKKNVVATGLLLQKKIYASVRVCFCCFRFLKSYVAIS